jgi:integrase/recombinase XerD
MTSPPPTTITVIEAFIRTRQARHVSHHHIRWLRYTLGHLARACPTLPTTPEPIEDMIANLTQGPETVYDIWRATTRLYRWAARRLDVPNAAADIEKPRRRKHLIRVLTELEVEHLLWVTRSRPRDYAMLLLFLDTGARTGDIVDMTSADVTPEAVRFRDGKGDDRYAPISPPTYNALRRFLYAQNLWRTPSGALSKSGIKIAVRRALDRANLTGGPHLLRHTFATLYLKNGGDLASLQAAGGWASLASVQVYVNITMRDTKSQHRRFSPVANHVPASQQLTMLPDIVQEA